MLGFPGVHAMGGVGRAPSNVGHAAAAGGRSPQSLPLETLIDNATDEALRGQPDWTINMQIVDIVNQLGQRDLEYVIEILRKKLMSTRAAIGLNAVILVEALVKNCVCIHPLIGTRSFMEECFVKSLPRSIRKPLEGPSLRSLTSRLTTELDTPLAHQRCDHILKCVQSWSQQFDHNKYPIFYECARMLERRGVRFPGIDKEANAPVFVKNAPDRAPGSPPRNGASASASASASSASSPAPASPPARVSTNVNDPELRAAEESAEILQEMLDASNFDDPADYSKDELIMQLVATCRSNAGIVSTRLTRAADGADAVSEEIMMAMLTINENLVNVIQYHQDLAAGKRKPDRPPAETAPTNTRAAASSSSSFSSSSAAVPIIEGLDAFAALAARHPPVKEGPSTAAPGGATPSASASASATPAKKTRRKSDLPPELTQFDMLSSASPEPSNQDHAYTHADTSMRQQPAVEGMPRASAPEPFMATSTATAAHIHSPPSKLSTSSSGSAGAVTPILAPPPASSSRRRKDSAARRSRAGSRDLGGSPMLNASVGSGSPAMRAHPSPLNKTPAHGSDLLSSFDLLSGQANAATTPMPTVTEGVAAPTPAPASTGPAHPSTATNIFDQLSNMSLDEGGSGQEGVPQSQPQVNPFDALEGNTTATAAPAEEEEDESDPFAAIAHRSPQRQ